MRPSRFFKWFGLLLYVRLTIRRRFRINLPLYVYLAGTTALPLGVFLLHRLAAAQASSLCQSATEEMVDATHLLVAMGVLVGLLQLTIVVGRIINSRVRELRILLAIAAMPRELLYLIVCEFIAHAAIGWAVGTFGILVAWIVLRLTLSELVAVSLTSIACAAGAVFIGAAGSVVPVSLLAVLRVLRGRLARPGNN